MTTEERLEHLERELTDLKAQLAMRVRTEAVEIVDKYGNIRAMLSVYEDGPKLGLADEAGEVRAMMFVTADGPLLGLLDAAGRTIWAAP